MNSCRDRGYLTCHAAALAQDRPAQALPAPRAPVPAKAAVSSYYNSPSPNPQFLPERELLNCRTVNANPIAPRYIPHYIPVGREGKSGKPSIRAYRGIEFMMVAYS